MVPARPPPRVALQATENTRLTTAAVAPSSSSSCGGASGDLDNRGGLASKNLFKPVVAVNSKKRLPQQPQGCQPSNQEYDGHPLQIGEHLQQHSSSCCSGVVATGEGGHPKTGASKIGGAGRAGSGVCSKRVKTSEEVSANVSQDRGVLSTISGCTSGVMVKPPKVSTSSSLTLTRSKNTVEAPPSSQSSKKAEGKAGVQKNAFHNGGSGMGVSIVLNSSTCATTTSAKLTKGGGRQTFPPGLGPSGGAENHSVLLTESSENTNYSHSSITTDKSFLNSQKKTFIPGVTAGDETRQSSLSSSLTTHRSQQPGSREPFADVQKNLPALNHDLPSRGDGGAGKKGMMVNNNNVATTSSRSSTTTTTSTSNHADRREGGNNDGVVAACTLDSTRASSSSIRKTLSLSSSASHGFTTTATTTTTITKADEGDGATGSHHGISSKSLLKKKVSSSKPSNQGTSATMVVAPSTQDGSTSSLHRDIKIVAVPEKKGFTSSNEGSHHSFTSAAPWGSSMGNLQQQSSLTRKNNDVKTVSSAGTATHALKGPGGSTMRATSLHDVSDHQRPQRNITILPSTQKNPQKQQGVGGGAAASGVKIVVAGRQKTNEGQRKDPSILAGHHSKNSKSSTSSSSMTLSRSDGRDVKKMKKVEEEEEEKHVGEVVLPSSDERLVRLCDRDDDIWNEWEGVRLLGEGVYGRVYLVRHKDTGEERAFKRMYLQTSRVGGTGWIDENVASGGLPAVVQREVSTLRALRNSPNVIRLEEVLVGSRRVYLSFPVIHGGSLSELMRRYASWQEHLLFLHQSQESNPSTHHHDSQTPSSLEEQEDEEELDVEIDVDLDEDEQKKHHPAQTKDRYGSSKCHRPLQTDHHLSLPASRAPDEHQPPITLSRRSSSSSLHSSASSSDNKKEDDVAILLSSSSSSSSSSTSSSSLNLNPTNPQNRNHQTTSTSTTKTAHNEPPHLFLSSSSSLHSHNESLHSSTRKHSFSDKKPSHPHRHHPHRQPIIFPPPFSYPSMPPCGLPLPLCKAITQAILRGIAACHEHRIAHRDLKPDNILVEWTSQHPPCPPPPPPSPASSHSRSSERGEMSDVGKETEEEANGPTLSTSLHDVHSEEVDEGDGGDHCMKIDQEGEVQNKGGGGEEEERDHDEGERRSVASKRNRHKMKTNHNNSQASDIVKQAPHGGDLPLPCKNKDSYHPQYGKKNSRSQSDLTTRNILEAAAKQLLQDLKAKERSERDNFPRVLSSSSSESTVTQEEKKQQGDKPEGERSSSFSSSSRGRASQSQEKSHNENKSTNRPSSRCDSHIESACCRQEEENVCSSSSSGSHSSRQSVSQKSAPGENASSQENKTTHTARIPTSATRTSSSSSETTRRGEEEDEEEEEATVGEEEEQEENRDNHPPSRHRNADASLPPDEDEEEEEEEEESDQTQQKEMTSSQETENSHSPTPSYPPLPLKLVIADFGLARTLPFHVSPSLSCEQHLTATKPITTIQKKKKQNFSSHSMNTLTPSSQRERRETSSSVPPSMQQQHHRICSSSSSSTSSSHVGKKTVGFEKPLSSSFEARHGSKKKNTESEGKRGAARSSPHRVWTGAVQDGEDEEKEKNELIHEEDKMKKKNRETQEHPHSRVSHRHCHGAQFLHANPSTSDKTSSSSSSVEMPKKKQTSGEMRNGQKLPTIARTIMEEEGEEREEQSCPNSDREATEDEEEEESPSSTSSPHEEDTEEGEDPSSSSSQLLSSSTAAPGTTFALSPEIITLNYRPLDVLLGSHSYSLCVDVWSAGCILMELLTGTELIDGCSEFQCIMAIMKLFGNPWRKHKKEKEKEDERRRMQKHPKQQQEEEEEREEDLQLDSQGTREEEEEEIPDGEEKDEDDEEEEDWSCGFKEKLRGENNKKEERKINTCETSRSTDGKDVNTQSRSERLKIQEAHLQKKKKKTHDMQKNDERPYRGDSKSTKKEKKTTAKEEEEEKRRGRDDRTMNRSSEWLFWSEALPAFEGEERPLERILLECGRIDAVRDLHLLDLASRLLEIMPDKRITAKEALEHAFFDNIELGDQL
ncbi:cmgc cdk family [Cystoisospora suis]|uniref:Cyclin-dependent kinase 2 homolog n=1 Tax=Cystoisospora suis TaxID=483139 RepID=A0A2C6LBT6_9APIC|nr:cmgc cdk family [Cystoisospora suis]